MPVLQELRRRTNDRAETDDLAGPVADPVSRRLLGRRNRPRYRLRSIFTEPGAVALGLVLLICSILPIYNMVMISLEHHGEVFSNNVWPPHPSLRSFWVVFTERHWYLEHFWRQFDNSLYLGLLTVFLTLLGGSLTASRSVGYALASARYSYAAFLTYGIPASVLAISFWRIMHSYSLADNRWSVIAADTTFAIRRI